MALSVTVPGNKSFKITKWKVKKGQMVVPTTILALYKYIGSEEIGRLKSNGVGTVNEMLIEEGHDGIAGEPVMTMEGCSHPTIMKDMCADCGADLRLLEDNVLLETAVKKPTSSKASVAMVHSIPELIVSEEQAMEIGRKDEQRLLQSRKLVLLVDLDQTLLHTTNDNIPVNLKDVEHFQLWHGRWMWYHTKFRPGTRDFLANISKLYELHICTFGVRMYAHTIAGILDPKREYFSHRILSRDECFSANSKTANLRSLFPCGDSMVSIIDDRDDVWRFAPNLIHVKPYHFFCGTADINAPPGLMKDGNDNKTIRHNVRIERIPHRKKNEKQQYVQDEGNVQNGKSLEGKLQVENHEEYQNEETSQKEETSQGESADNKLNDININNEKKIEMEVIESQVDGIQHIESKNDESGMELDEINEQGARAASEDSKEDDISNINNEHPEASGDNKTETVQTQEQTKQMEIETQGDGDNSGCPESVSCVQDGTEIDQMETKADQSDDLSIQTKISQTTNESKDSKGTTDKNISNDLDISDSSNSDHDGSKLMVVCDPGESENGEKTISNKVQDEQKLELKSAESSQKSEKEEGELVTSEEESQKLPMEEYDEVIVWEDTDDYLIYLEDILKRIHHVYYEMYDEKPLDIKKDIPDMKKVIPYVRKKVLKGANILFSGVIPTNQPADKSRAYNVAKSLGASIHTTFIPLGTDNKETATTHLVAAKPGTAKVIQARKHSKVSIVNPDWLWACNDRWEWVDERLFELKEDSAYPFADSPDPWKPKKKKKEAKEENKKTKEENKLDYNPLFAFSTSDIKTMDAEVDDILDESESEDSDSELRRVVLGYSKKRERESSSEESMTGEYPKGWGKKRSKCDPDNIDKASDDEMEDDECELTNKIINDPKGLLAGSDNSSNSSYNDSIGSLDDEMAAALEKEFLSY